MGMTFRHMVVPASKGRSGVEDAFRDAQLQSMDTMRCGCSGGWDMAPSIKWREDIFPNVQRAISYLEFHCRKWEPAIVVRCRNGVFVDWVVGAMCGNDK